eukprot:394085_1
MDEDIWGNDNDDGKQTVVDNNNSNNNHVYNTNNTRNGNITSNIGDNKEEQEQEKEQSSLFRYFSTESEISTDIRIVNTEERKGKITKYTVYIIESDVFGANLSVARRYNDFKWLYNNLGIEFLAPFIPPLAPTNTFERFKDEVVSQRRYDLERFLNRINNNKTLKTSSSFELFLCEQSDEVFEEQKKINKKILNERNDYDIISLLMRNYENLDSIEIPDGISSFDDKNSDDIYQLDMPRVREFFMRCDERFVSLNKISNNLFKIMANISSELNTLYDGLNELYETESFDQPTIIKTHCQQRYDIRDFMNKWKELEESQMNSFYKYFLLHLRYEHEDIKSILDGFKRYDNIYNRYKKQKQSLKKQTEKYPDKDYTVQQTQLNEIKSLLDLICKIILINDTPKLWNKKINNYNKAINHYIQNVTTKTL